MPRTKTHCNITPSDLDIAILALTEYAIPVLTEMASVGRLRGDDLPAFRAALRNLKRHRAARNIVLRNWKREHPEWTKTENTCSCSQCGYTIQGDNPAIESVCALCYR